MILRTPPVRKRRAESEARPPEDSSPISNLQQLIIYEDEPSALEPSQDHHFTSDQMLCTYQCRQMVKSEFLDALSTAEKEAQDSKSKFKALNDELHKMDAERKKYHDQFLHAEQELAAAKGREESLQDQLMKELDSSQERFTKQMQLYSELEVKFQHEKSHRAKAESAAASAEEKASLYERKHNDLSESMEREKRRLHNELELIKTESAFSVSSIKKNLEKMECRAVNAEKESALLKGHLQDVRVRLNECMEQRSELEKKLSSFTFQESCSTDDNVLVKHLQEELRHYEAEVREARLLKSSHESIELLKEKLLEEKGRRERAECELTKLADLEVAVKDLEKELSTWKSTVLDIPGISCPDDIPRKFASLQKEVLQSMAKTGEEARRIKSLERETDRLRSEIALLESKLGHGDYSSASTKVLRMVNTLGVDAEAKQTIDALQAELQKTKQKLQALEELKQADYPAAAQILRLKEQVATLEKREARYKTVFADRISVFRRACCELFGYKIVMDDHQRADGIAVTRFTLQSVYALCDDEKLEFEYESGNTNVLANQYTSQPDISRQVEIFVRKMNSIPAFTANLTVESFNKRTFS